MVDVYSLDEESCGASLFTEDPQSVLVARLNDLGVDHCEVHAWWRIIAPRPSLGLFVDAAAVENGKEVDELQSRQGSESEVKTVCWPQLNAIKPDARASQVSLRDFMGKQDLVQVGQV
ncbi:hypothetical protein GmRootV213_26660 [Variovorax sp. V213]